MLVATGSSKEYQPDDYRHYACEREKCPEEMSPGIWSSYLASGLNGTDVC